MNFPSKVLESVVQEFEKLPGVGKRSALRMALHLLKRPAPEVDRFGKELSRMAHELQFCALCHNVSDTEVCSICNNNSRDHELLCVVSDVRDVMAIENTNRFRGVYHVLNGLISPMDGIGPGDLTIQALMTRLETKEFKEVILALSPNTEGDTTLFYLYKKLEPLKVLVTTLSRGLAFGGDLEFADEVTLARSLEGRIPYAQTLKS